MNVPEVTEQIADLYKTIRNTTNPNEIANKINSILIFGNDVPLHILRASWNYFAKQNGVHND